MKFKINIYLYILILLFVIYIGYYFYKKNINEFFNNFETKFEVVHMSGKEDRLKNIERIAFLAGKISKHGVLVLVPVIAPYQSARKQARELSKNFVEVFISASLETVKSRDPKGLYKKALSGEIKNFTGVSDPYEIPENPDIHIETEKLTVEESCNKIISYLEKHGYLDCLNPVENL